MPMLSPTRLERWMRSPAFTRYISGDLRIVIAEYNWPDSWYHDPYYTVSLPLVFRIADTVSSANDFQVSYDAPTDFHHVQFTYDNDTFLVRWYKTFILHRQSDRMRVDFGFREYLIADFLNKPTYKVDRRWRLTSEARDPFAERDNQSRSVANV